MRKRIAVFFDRDDTLIKNIPYNGDPQLVKLVPFAKKALLFIEKANFDIFLISNQSAVGRGYITKDQVEKVNARLIQILKKDFFTKIYCCFDDPDNPIDFCRKPSPAMILKAEQEFNIDLKKSFMVGDKISDIQTGLNAGCRTVLVKTKSNGEDVNWARIHAHFVADNLLKAAEWICQGINNAF